jgi:hypothetical protein
MRSYEMTQIILKNEERPRGNDRIRRALPALGLVAAAITGYSAQGSGGQTGPDPDARAPLTVELISHETTLLHHARAQGIGDGLRKMGVPFSEALAMRMTEVSEAVDAARNDRTSYQIDMAYLAGRQDASEDASEGAWSAAALETYVRTIDFAAIGIREIADRATLRWETRLGIDQSRETVRAALAVNLMEGSEIPASLRSQGGTGLAVLADVSGHLRPLLDHLHDTAFGPPPALPDDFYDMIVSARTEPTDIDQPEI